MLRGVFDPKFLGSDVRLGKSRAEMQTDRQKKRTNKQTNKVTNYPTVLFENLRVPQLVKTFPCILRNSDVIYGAQKGPTIVPILRQLTLSICR